MRIKTKVDIEYIIVDFATHSEEKHCILPAGSELDAVFVDDELLSKIEDEHEKGFMGSLKGYYYADVVVNGIADYKDWYIMDHELDIFAFKPEDVEVIDGGEHGQ